MEHTFSICWIRAGDIAMGLSLTRGCGKSGKTEIFKIAHKSTAEESSAVLGGISHSLGNPTVEYRHCWQLAEW